MLIHFLKVYSLLVNSVLNLTDDIRIRVFVSLGLILQSQTPLGCIFCYLNSHCEWSLLFKCWKIKSIKLLILIFGSDDITGWENSIFGCQYVRINGINVFLWVVKIIGRKTLFGLLFPQSCDTRSSCWLPSIDSGRFSGGLSTSP